MSTPLYRSRPGGFDLQPASQEEARQINDFVYLSEGLSNTFLIVTPEGRVVVNAGTGFEATHTNLNDMTNAGIACDDKRAFGVQFHPEAAPGPHDAQHLFGRFRRLIRGEPAAI